MCYSSCLQCVFNRTTVGAVSAVHKCILDVPGVLAEALDGSMIAEMLLLLEKITLLLLGVLYGDQNMEDKGTCILVASVQNQYMCPKSEIKYVDHDLMWRPLKGSAESKKKNKKKNTKQLAFLIYWLFIY